MKITVSKFFAAEMESDDPATEELRSRVLSPMGGSFEEETNLVWKNGGGR